MDAGKDIKHHHDDESTIVLTCSKGIAPMLAAELSALDFPIVQESVASITTRGTFHDCMRLNLQLRTAQRVLYQLNHFRAEDPDMLYERLSQIKWDELISPDVPLSVTSVVDTPTIRDTRFANLKVKDAVVDKIKASFGRRPDSGPSRKGAAVVHLYWKGQDATVYIDTSGEPLYKRGYRLEGLVAPLQETLGAAIMLCTGWRGLGHLLNPMCGSGTLSIEAAMLALDMAPGSLREEFGFMHTKLFNKAGWEEIKTKEAAKHKTALSHRIIASDISPEAVEAARNNAREAGVEEHIDFAVSDFADSAVPAPAPGAKNVLVMNPEYGERLGSKAELQLTYPAIGDFLKQKCHGYTGYVLAGNMKLMKTIGLKTSRRIPLYNGPIECRLLEFELYAGTKKAAPNL